MENNYIKLNEKYRLTSDGSRNLILQKEYFKKEGKGKGSPETNEITTKDVGYFGAGLVALGKRLNEYDFMEAFESEQKGQEFKEAFEDMKVFLNEREDRMIALLKEHFNEYIKENLKNVKPPEEEKPMTMSAKKNKK